MHSMYPITRIVLLRVLGTALALLNRGLISTDKVLNGTCPVLHLPVMSTYTRYAYDVHTV